MPLNSLPKWITELEIQDLKFIKKFILSSGSLKEIANQYDVSYPTVRLRLDRLIQKINLNDNKFDEPFTTFIKELALDEKMDLDTAKQIITEYEREKKEDDV